MIARMTSATPCSAVKNAGHGNDGLEVIERRPARRQHRALAEPPRHLGEVVPRPHQGDDPGKEEDEEEDQIEGGLGLHRPEAVEDITADVVVLGQGVGAAQHELGAVQHVGDVVGPLGRRVEEVAEIDVPGRDQHEGDDQPAERDPDPRADRVDPLDGFFHVVQGNGGPDMAPIPPSARSAPAKPERSTVDMAAPRSSAPPAGPDPRTSFGLEVVVEGGLVVDHDLLAQRHHALGPLSLRLDDLGEEGVALRLLLDDLVPGLELSFQHGLRRLHHADLVLVLQLQEIGRVPVHELPGHVGRLGHDRVLEDGLGVLVEALPFLLVHQQLEELHRLVVALDHVDLGDVLEAEHLVGGGVVELGGIDDAAIEGRDDVGAAHDDHRGAELPEELRREPDRAVLDALEVLGLLDLALLEPAERLGGHRSEEQGDDVELHLLEQLVVELLAPAVVHPAEEALGVEPEGRAGPEQAEGHLLAEPVGGNGPAAVESAGVHGLDDLKGPRDGADGEHVDPDPTSSQLLDLLGETSELLMEDVLGRDTALYLEGDGLLRRAPYRPHGGRGAGRHGRALEEGAPRGGAGGLGAVLGRVGCGRALHVCPSSRRGALRGVPTRENVA